MLGWAIKHIALVALLDEAPGTVRLAEGPESKLGIDYRGRCGMPWLVPM